MNLNKFLAYVVLAVALFGLLTLHSQSKEGFKWKEVKYEHTTRVEMKATLTRIFGDDADDYYYRANRHHIVEATDQELRDYLYHLDKASFPMESIAEEHEESMEVEKMSRLGRVLLAFLLFLGGVKILKRYNIGDKYKIVRFLKKFDVGFKQPDKDEK
jgi:hypothetical protein